jgi:predicted N-acetyltransferase YhbS
MIEIRREKSIDPAAIRRVVDGAFGRPKESAALDALRHRGALALSLVAIRADTIIGYVAFTAIGLDDKATPTWPDDPPAAGAAPADAKPSPPRLIVPPRRVVREVPWMSLETEFEREEHEREMAEVAAAAAARAVARKPPAEKVTRMVSVTTGQVAAPPLLTLGPLAVLPNQQRRGIGGELVEAGLEQLSRMHAQAVFVLGDPGFYSRFGFVGTRPFGIGCDPPVKSDLFQVYELRTGAIQGASGVVRFEPELQNLD